MLQQVKREHVVSEEDKKLVQRANVLLKRDQCLLSPKSTSHLQELLARYEQLRVVYDYRESLQYVWQKTASSQKELVDSLQAWCRQAEESGLDSLRQFAQQLKTYAPLPA